MLATAQSLPLPVVVDEDERIEGKILRIRYTAPGGDMRVFEVRLDDGSQRSVCQRGDLTEVEKDDQVTIIGKYVQHKRFGRQFLARDVFRRMPSTGAGYVTVLSGKAFKGIGKSIAQKVVDHFGSDLTSILDRGDPAGMIGALIGIKKAKVIVDTWLSDHAINSAHARLAELKVPGELRRKIIEGYPEFERILREDPYRFAREIDGVGFSTADALARAAGTFREDSPGRLAAGTFEALDQGTSQGHTGLSFAQLVDRACDVLTYSDRQAISKIIEDSLLSGALVRSPNDLIQRVSLAKIETRLARNIVRLARTKPHMFPPHLVEQVVSTVARKYKLTDEQALAITAAMTNGLSIFTGGPGTGKTTTLRALEEAYEILCKQQHIEGKILQLSPTGKAADRMEESTDRPASTIHMGLGRDPENPGAGFKHHENNPLPFDLIVIDEGSMMDTRIADSALRAMKHCRVVIVGDVDQLPSVDAGRVLNDLIDSGICPVTRLTKVHRTGEGSAIALGAAAIREGQMPEFGLPGKSDLVFIEIDDPEDAAMRIEKQMSETLPKFLDISSDAIQALTPGKNSAVGLHALNKRLQAACNPNPPITLKSDTDRVSVRNGHQIRAGDRVMCMKTVYSDSIYNGDSGKITSFTVNGDDATVELVSRRKTLHIDRSYWSNLDLAYATTIHKSQGSEYDVVIIPLTTSHWMMLKRNLLYTGVTRAKKLCIIVGTRKALKIAISTPDGTIRQTGLLARIKAFA